MERGHRILIVFGGDSDLFDWDLHPWGGHVLGFFKVKGTEQHIRVAEIWFVKESVGIGAEDSPTDRH